MAIDLKTARPCERCATPGVPYGMHACRECRALYCTPACAVAHWRGGHRRACAIGRDERFVADVAYGLRASHLTTCVVCTCGNRPDFDPRLRALGLEPVSVAQPCLGACDIMRAVAAKPTQTPCERASEIAAAIVAESERRADLDSSEFAALFNLLATAIRRGSIDVDAAAVERLWKVCRMLFKTLIRMPADAPAGKRTPQSAIHSDLLVTLRKWADVGQKCADMYVTMVLSELVPEDNTAALIDGVDYRLAFRALQESLVELR